MQIVEDFNGFTFSFNWSQSSPGHNCGMSWLTDMYLYKSIPSNKNKLIYSSSPVILPRREYANIAPVSMDGWDKPTLTLSEAWAFWDRNKDKILNNLKTYSLARNHFGFYLISDSVNVHGDTNWGQKKAGQQEFTDAFTKTVHFMNWVAARQIGNLVRGPIGNNLCHKEDKYVNNEGRCVTSWFWQPSAEVIIDPNVEVLSNKFQANQALPKLLENCKEYTDYEHSLIPKPASEKLKKAA